MSSSDVPILELSVPGQSAALLKYYVTKMCWLKERRFYKKKTPSCIPNMHAVSVVLNAPLTHIFQATGTRLVSCHVMSCHVMSCHVMSCHVMSCHVMSCHVMSCHVMSFHIISYHIMSCSRSVWCVCGVYTCVFLRWVGVENALCGDCGVYGVRVERRNIVEDGITILAVNVRNFHTRGGRLKNDTKRRRVKSH